MTAHPGRWLVVLGLLTWILSVGLVVYYLLEPAVGFAGCEAVPGHSLYGEPSRSWLPPGLTCTYDRGELSGTLGAGERLVDGPPAHRLAVLALAAAGLPLCVRLHRLLRRPVLSASSG